MKKIIFSATGIAIVFTLFTSGIVFAQEMKRTTDNIATGSDSHTAREETEGKAVWEKLQTKELACKDLTDDNFGTLGEYFMGRMIGTSHEAMNNMMIQTMGEQDEERMHIVMGERLSGCDASAAFPSGSMGFMSMMQMMSGRWSSPFGSNQSNNSMINFGFAPFGGFGWIFMILWWFLIIAGIVALVRWLSGQFQGGASRKSALDILKDRYAKGEIDKKEFEEKKKDLS